MLTISQPVRNIRTGFGRKWNADTSIGRFGALLVAGIPEANLLPGQTVATVSGGSIGYVNGRGRLTFANASDKRWVSVLPSLIPEETTPFWMFLASVRSVSDARTYFRLGPATGSGALTIQTGAASNTMSVVSNSVILFTSATNTSPTGFFTAVVESTGGSVILYINGIQVGSTTTAISGARTRFGFGGDGTSQFSIAAAHEMCGLIAGPMPANFPRDFHANQHKAVFAANLLKMPHGAAAASAPTLSASTYVPGSLTGTGWRPRVTATF